MFSTIDSKVEYAPGDPMLIKNIVSLLKSQGVFDQFRKECISDVDTKVSFAIIFNSYLLTIYSVYYDRVLSNWISSFQPAYQNLCHRVDGRVESYLSDTKWGPDLNKNQLRENIRKHINE